MFWVDPFSVFPETDSESLRLSEVTNDKIQTCWKVIKEKIPGHPKFNISKETLEELCGLNFSGKKYRL